jgi:hypothetical protein
MILFSSLVGIKTDVLFLKSRVKRHFYPYEDLIFTFALKLNSRDRQLFTLFLPRGAYGGTPAQEQVKEVLNQMKYLTSQVVLTRALGGAKGPPAAMLATLSSKT